MLSRPAPVTLGPSTTNQRSDAGPACDHAERDESETQRRGDAETAEEREQHRA